MDRLTVQFPLWKTPFLHVVAGFVISVLIASYGDHGEFLWKYLRIPAVADSGNSIFVGIASYVDVEVDRTLELDRVVRDEVDVVGHAGDADAEVPVGWEAQVGLGGAVEVAAQVEAEVVEVLSLREGFI